MKLIFCGRCRDVRALHRDRTACTCGLSWGHYRGNGLDAVVGGHAIVLGLHNRDLDDLAHARRDECATIRAWRFTTPHRRITRLVREPVAGQGDPDDLTRPPTPADAARGATQVEGRIDGQGQGERGSDR